MFDVPASKPVTYKSEYAQDKTRVKEMSPLKKQREKKAAA